jgi:CRP-like cAMP-binding protein
VKAEMNDASGRIIKMEDIMAPSPMASAFLFGENNRFPVDIIATQSSTVLIIPKETLVQLFKESTSFLQNFLDTVSTRSQFLTSKIRFLSFQTIKGKVAHFILSKTSPTSDCIVLNQNQTQLAELFGVTRPSLARAIKEMEQQNIIRWEPGKVTIINVEALKSLVR